MDVGVREVEGYPTFPRSPELKCDRKMSSSSSWCCAISMDIPDPLSPPFPIVHCFRQIFRATSRIGKELMYVGWCWSSCICSSMCWGPQEYITYELDPTFLYLWVIPRNLLFKSSYFDAKDTVSIWYTSLNGQSHVRVTSSSIHRP